MHERIGTRIATLAALLVLFSALLDPRISLGLALTFLLILAGYWFLQKKRKST